MFGVCLCPHRNDEVNNQWSYVLTSWPPADVYLHAAISNPFELKGNRLKHLRDAVCVKTLSELPSDQEIVLLASKQGLYVSGKTSLVDFDHPENCIYVFGNDDDLMTAEFFGDRTPDHIVYIPTNEELSSHTAGAIVLYDRATKNG